MTGIQVFIQNAYHQEGVITEALLRGTVPDMLFPTATAVGDPAGSSSLSDTRSEEQLRATLGAGFLPSFVKGPSLPAQRLAGGGLSDISLVATIEAGVTRHCVFPMAGPQSFITTLTRDSRDHWAQPNEHAGVG